MPKEMCKTNQDKAKQFAIEQSERIKQDYDNFMFPNRNAPSQTHVNIRKRIFESELKRRKSIKEVFNNLQEIMADTASIYNQTIGTPINWGKIEKQRYQLGNEFYDLEEILAVDPNKINHYESRGYLGNKYFVELGDFSAIMTSSLEEAKKLAGKIKKEVETIHNSINRKELNPYFRELYGKDIPSFSTVIDTLNDPKTFKEAVNSNA
jgi:RNA binding exosome subunit